VVEGSEAESRAVDDGVQGTPVSDARMAALVLAHVLK